MKYLISDIKNSYPKEKAEAEPLWGRIFVRKVSFYVTLPFINAGWSANKVSLLSCLFAVVGSIVMCFDSLYAIWAGVILLNIWSILDCVDGNIARCKKESSYAGNFFDAMGGYCICALSLFGAGVAAYNTSFLIPEKYRIYIVFAGSLGSICDIWSRLIYQNFTNNLIKITGNSKGEKNELVKNAEEGKSLFGAIKTLSRRIDYEIGTGGDELLFLVIAATLHIIDIFTVLYALYHIAGLILVFITYINSMNSIVRSSKYE